MKESLAVRSLLVDKANGRFIKAIEQRDLNDYIDAYRAPKGNVTVVFDFAPVVGAFHMQLANQFSSRDHSDLVIAKNSVFNSWVRFKSMTNGSMHSQFAAQLSLKCEEVLSTIHMALPDRYKKYQLVDGGNADFTTQKRSAFDDLMCYINAFIETMLCDVHITTIVDAQSWKHDSVLSGHAEALRQKLVEYIQAEAAFWRGTFQWNSLIYQCCMEDMGIAVDPLLSMMDAPFSKEQIREQILCRSRLTTETDGRHSIRRYVNEWPEADPTKLERVKALALALQQILALSNLMKQLKAGEFDPSTDAGTPFDAQVEALLTEGRKPALSLRKD